jgi:copper ion binding protein
MLFKSLEDEKMSKEKTKKSLNEETIDVKGMSCKSCSDSIESRISSFKGVEEVKVDLLKDRVTVKFDPGIISFDRIKSEIRALGYSAGEEKKEKRVEGAKSKSKTVWQGIAYGVIPHLGCIAFIIASVLGVTVLTQFFKPLLMSRNFFYILILLSLLLATVSSVIYLRRNGFLSSEGIRKKWKYLTTMYGVTIGVNLLLFLVIFPLLANVNSVSAASSSTLPTASPLGGSPGIIGADASSFSSLQLKVSIPCSGHASLISGELKTIDGVQSVKFSLPNNFAVSYDPAKTSKEQILALSVFKEYPATVISEFIGVTAQQNTAVTAGEEATAAKSLAGQATGATGGCGCGGGSGGCGGSGGGCGGANTGITGGTCGAKY